MYGIAKGLKRASPKTRSSQKITLKNVTAPLYLSPVSCGFPSPADDYIETPLDLNERLIKKPAATFFVYAKGGGTKEMVEEMLAESLFQAWLKERMDSVVQKDQPDDRGAGI